MKAYRLEILILDFEKVGEEGIVDIIKNTKYANYCISPDVLTIQEADIGMWSDDHPFNYRSSHHTVVRQTFDNLARKEVK